MQRRRVNTNNQESGRLVLLKLPRSSDKTQEAAEQLFNTLHAVASKDNLKLRGRHAERLSFEIAAVNKTIGFYVWIPDRLKTTVSDQIYAQYPDIQIIDAEDYTQKASRGSSLISEIRLIENDVLPIKARSEFKADPLSTIMATLSELGTDEQVWIQLIVTPTDAGWHQEANRHIETLKNGNPGSLISTIMGISKTAKAAATDIEKAKAAETKNAENSFLSTIRIVYQGNTKPLQAKLRMQAVVASFMQFNTSNYNKFHHAYLGTKSKYLVEYKQRKMSIYNSILSVSELATIYHLPYAELSASNIIWSSVKATEPPQSLPVIDEDTPEALKSEISPIAYTNYHGKRTKFGLPRSDRSRHLYILGQTGVGKSALLELLTIADINSPYGFAVIDPHGDYAVSILKRIPESRIDDVVYINPADIDYPIAFNPLEIFDPRLKNHICLELINVLKPLFESFNPRIEYVIRCSILALLDYPESTLLDIPRILSDSEFRARVIPKIEDQVVANFWVNEFDEWNETHLNSAIAPVLNKLGAFTTNPIIRNIISHPKSSFSIREIMDDRRILIINLSQGLIGEENANILGSLIVSSIQRAAMSRADIEDIDKRIPFYLYVDEFQNFATESFKTILSEARKYGLILTVANQYIDQMDRSVSEAIFGNVGSKICFRLSSDDAKTMAKYYKPTFDDYDLIHLHNRHVAISMTIDGEKVPAFNAETITLPVISDNHAAEIIKNSRLKYATNARNIDPAIFITPSGLAPSDKIKSKDEVVKDIGHLVRAKTNSQKPKRATYKKGISLKAILSGRAGKVHDFDEDESVKLH